MKIPRDLTGRDLAVSLRKLGYSQARQVGSHIRLTTTQKGQHHVTVPDHVPLKIGT
ncbi:MAG: type II toxin-antitoxin system HicA family toxin [Taibaiella sp.]|nr:type II toxin-antitoxin system HicA family toxin [Taibaiella sp.]